MDITSSAIDTLVHRYNKHCYRYFSTYI